MNSLQRTGEYVTTAYPFSLTTAGAARPSAAASRRDQERGTAPLLVRRPRVASTCTMGTSGETDVVEDRGVTDSAKSSVKTAAGGGSSSRYSLAGIRQATTQPHEAFIARACEVLSEDDRVLAAYLVGGFAVGMGDAFSDVDLHIVIADEAADELADTWRDLVQHIAPTISAEAFGTHNPARPRSQAIGGVCITPDWLHFDVVFRPASTVDARAIEGMVPLLDKAGLLPSSPTPRPDRRSEPFYPEGAVSMFLYTLGNAVAAIGRDEPIPASNGVILVRDICLVGLLLAEQGLASTREANIGNPFLGLLHDSGYRVLIEDPRKRPRERRSADALDR